MESTRPGAGIAPSLQALDFLAPEQRSRTAGAYADDWYPPDTLIRELDRAADAILRADAIANGYVVGEDGNSLRTYQASHGLAVRPRSRRLTDEDRARLGPADLMAEFSARPSRPVGPDWGHRATCGGCRRRAAGAPVARVDEDARIADAADRAARLVEAARDELAARQAPTAPELDRRPAVDAAGLDALVELVPDFALIAERAEGATYEAIGARLGVHHEVARRRFLRAQSAARALIRAQVCEPVDTGSRGRDLDSRDLGDSSNANGDRTAATGPETSTPTGIPPAGVVLEIER